MLKTLLRLLELNSLLFCGAILNETHANQFEEPCFEEIYKNTEDINNTFVKKVIHAEAHMTVPQLIRSKGFKVEIHNVTSTDGYITTLFRIPHGRFPKNDTFPKKVAYFQHGFMVDAASWVLNAIDKSLAYRLADLGDVDVWMGNSRGTANSLGHVNLSSIKNYQYWNFSFHEVAIMDLPKIIDYILNVTHQPDLYYISHSMGCNVLCVCLSTFPEYNSKIRTFIAMAPGVFVGNASSPLHNLPPELIRKAQKLHDTFLSSSVGFPHLLAMGIMSFVGDFCAPRVIFHKICYKLIESFFGFDFQEINYDMSVEIAAHGFSSTSTKTLFHIFQMTTTGEYKQYDYDFERNNQIYGQRHPPKYDLSKITAPTVLYCGPSDNLCSCIDVDRLSKTLPNVKEFKQITWSRFNHIDFLFSKNINPLLNNRIVEIVKFDLFYKK